MPIGATFHDWSEATLTSLGSALALLLAAIPKIIGFALILLIGWFISSGVWVGGGTWQRGTSYLCPPVTPGLTRGPASSSSGWDVKR